MKRHTSLPVIGVPSDPFEGVDRSFDVRQLGAADAHWRHDALARLLCNVVDAGASIGRLAPLAPSDALRYWVELQPLLDERHRLWIATSGEQVVGAIQLRGRDTPDAAHRATIAGLIVDTGWRAHGVATALLAAAEAQARVAGRTLLVLDVESDTPAQAFFARRHWRHAGTIPAYATSARGVLRAFARLYKSLGAEGEP